MPDSAAPPRSGIRRGAADSGEGADPAGAPVTGGLRRFGRRYPAVGRAAVGVLCAVASPFAMPPRGLGLAVAAAAAVVAWNLAYLWALLPDGRACRCYRATCVVDVVLVCGLCLAKPVLVDPGQQVASLGWISPIASFTVVAVQFQLGALLAAAATSPSAPRSSSEPRRRRDSRWGTACSPPAVAGCSSRPCSRGCCGCCCSAPGARRTA